MMITRLNVDLRIFLCSAPDGAGASRRKLFERRASVTINQYFGSVYRHQQCLPLELQLARRCNGWFRLCSTTPHYRFAGEEYGYNCDDVDAYVRQARCA